jgi:hypothetical protein
VKCACGCGIETLMANYPDKRYGRVKGEPNQYLRGHANRRPPEERFWEKVDKGNGADSCWIWTAYTNKGGYGCFGVTPINIVLAHRYSYILCNGDIPQGLCVLHRCDTPPCVNPAHLFLGTDQDNVIDMLNKGRYVGFMNCDFKGEFNPSSKLSNADIVNIKRLMDKGHKGIEIAKLFNVSTSIISSIKTGIAWKHL